MPRCKNCQYGYRFANFSRTGPLTLALQDNVRLSKGGYWFTLRLGLRHSKVGYNDRNGVRSYDTFHIEALLYGPKTINMVRVWPITGSSRGVGRVLAEKVLELGDIVIATTRNPSQFDDLITKYGRDFNIAFYFYSLG
ncbi:hypothetical protein IWW34DRAFT_812225 [Fusarium oxysporum f. sp. albedinis]|nr:hypothetical protein IWW34DRAFT_812225 [Fusarium oxysporum f. sp. albedinis]